ncbi:hypothetical protein L1049_016872 [Liquidambar formosana]|uniref:Uncharacterized protein n=1 Tax=Liquidambar formosana TaxID=63359 RepID=A0AAP0X3D7_LIQFO
MAQSGGPSDIDGPVWVISDVFCCPSPVVLLIVREVMNLTSGNFVVKDVNGNVLFRAKEIFFTMHGRQVLLDAFENPIVNIRKKIMTAHKRCHVFKGDISDARDLLFTTKRHSILPCDNEIQVFLPNNKVEEICDFRVKWEERSCVVYLGESSTAIAEMKRKHNVQSVVFGKDKLILTVYPQIDYAFIVALIVFLDDVYSEGRYDLLWSAATKLASFGIGVAG